VNAGRHVDLDARERIQLTMIGGGLGIGGVGVGAGISILSLGEQVQAFIGSGAQVRAGSVDSSGDVTLDARLKADLSVLGVTGGFGTGFGVAAAVAVIHDNSDVKAFLEDQTDTATGVRILGADQVRITAERGVAIHVSTVGAAGGITGGLGAAVVVAEANGNTQARVGSFAQIGSESGAPGVGAVTVQATSHASIGSFGSSAITSAAMAVGGVGALAAGVVVATIDVNTEASIGDEAGVYASGVVTVDADSVLHIDVDADGGALGAIAIGAMFGYANIGTSNERGRTRAWLGNRSTVVSSGLTISAGNDTDADVALIAANGGAIAGGGGEAKVTIASKVEAGIGDSAEVRSSGAVTIEALALDSDAHAAARGGSVGAVAVTIFEATATNNGSTKASVGDKTHIDAAAFTLKSDSHDRAETDLFTLGIGLGAGAVGTATSNGNASTSTTVGKTASLVASGEVLILARSNQTAEADADSVSGGGIAVGLIDTHANLTNKTETTIDTGALLRGSTGFTVRSDSTSHADADSNGGSGALIDIAEAKAYATISDTVTTSVGNGASLTANANMLVEALRSTELDTTAKVDAGGLGANTNTVSSGTISSANTTVTVGSATISGQNLTVRAKTRALDADVTARSKASAAGADSDAAAQLDSQSHATTEIKTGAKLYGRDMLTVGAYQDRLATAAKATAITNGLGGDTDPEGRNNLTANTKVDADAGASLRTRNLLVEANTAPNPTYTLTLVKDGAVIDFGSESGTSRLTLNQTIEFDATVVMLGAPSPELVIDTLGNASTRINIDYQKIGNDIVVSDITNTGALAGSIVFRINPVSFVSTVTSAGVSGSGSSASVIRGAPKFDFVTSYESVQISNASAGELRIGAIDVLNRSNQFSSSITVNVANKSAFVPVSRTVTGTTDLRIIATGGGDIVLNKLIANPLGSSLVSSGTGDILSGGVLARIDSDHLTLDATGGAIGASSAPIRIDSNLFSAHAASGIAAQEVNGNLNIVQVQSTAGQVQLTAAGSILDANSGADADISAPDVVLTAINGSIGTLANPLEIDVSGASLYATAQGDIAVTDTLGSMGVGQVTSSAGSIVLAVVDHDNSVAEDLVLGATSAIRALAGTISLDAGDDITAQADSVIQAAGLVRMRADHGDADIGTGVTIDLRGSILGSLVDITGGADSDIVSLTGTQSRTRADGGAGDNLFHVGSQATPGSSQGGLLDGVAAQLTIMGGTSGNDRLVLDDSGDTGANTGQLSSAALTGLGMGEGIVYGGIEHLEIGLGHAADILRVRATHAGTETTVRLGDGADQALLGDSVLGLNAFDGLLAIDGEQGVDHVQVTDGADTADNAGQLSATRLTGLGMGASNQRQINASLGVQYQAFEALDLMLGQGNDLLRVSDILIDTHIAGQGGDDTVAMGGTAAGSTPVGHCGAAAPGRRWPGRRPGATRKRRRGRYPCRQ
jgi:hypothetical protein